MSVDSQLLRLRELHHLDSPVDVPLPDLVSETTHMPLLRRRYGRVCLTSDRKITGYALGF